MLQTFGAKSKQTSTASLYSSHGQICAAEGPQPHGPSNSIKSLNFIKHEQELH